GRVQAQSLKSAPPIVGKNSQSVGMSIHGNLHWLNKNGGIPRFFKTGTPSAMCLASADRPPEGSNRGVPSDVECLERDEAWAGRTGCAFHHRNADGEWPRLHARAS